MNRTEHVLTVREVEGEERDASITDVARLDLRQPANWTQMGNLIRSRFHSCFERQHKATSSNGSSTKQSKNDEWYISAFDEFIIEQAASIGLRVLFDPTVLITLYNWTQRPEDGRELWSRFAKSIQRSFDQKRFRITDARVPQFRDELIEDFKTLKVRLRSRKATRIRWNFSLHIRNLERELENFPAGALGINGTKFVAFIEENEEIFKNWILPGGSLSNRELADHFLANCYGYKTAESARQAIQRLKRRSLPARHRNQQG